MQAAALVLLVTATSPARFRAALIDGASSGEVVGTDRVGGAGTTTIRGRARHAEPVRGVAATNDGELVHP